MMRTVAPGKQRVIELKKRMFLVIESPIIRVVGWKSGRGETGDEFLRLADEGDDFDGDFSRGDGALVGGDRRVGAATGADRGAGVNWGRERRRAPGRVGCLRFLDFGESDGGAWDPFARRGKSWRSRISYLFSCWMLCRGA